MNDIIQLLLNSTNTAQRCQRNWDLSKTIDSTILSCLKDVVKNSPTKQNEEYYQVSFITDRSVIESLYQVSYDNRHTIKNPQTLAQLLIVFNGLTPSTNRNLALQYSINELSDNQHQSIGIVSGQVALAANMLGLKTGFCACFDRSAVSQILNINNPLLMLGVGYPDKTKLRRQHHDASFKRKYFSSFEKPITITTIGDTTSIYHYDGVLLPKAYTSTIILTAPTRQEIKNQSDLSMLPQQFQDEAINFLFETGIKYKVEPHPYIEEWNIDQTAITMEWTDDSQIPLESMVSEIKQYLASNLLPLGWIVT